MHILWGFLGAAGGLVIGAILGFGIALVLMSVTKQPGGGAFGMADVLICVPSGALVGLIAGAWWGLR